MSIGIYEGLTGEKYFPYADSLVPSAFQIGRFSPFANYNSLDEQAAYLAKGRTDTLNQLAIIMGVDNWNSFLHSDKHLFIFPISPLTPELFSWFADSQVHHQLVANLSPTSSSSSNSSFIGPTVPTGSETDDVTQRIHPGNPHLYWRFLWSKHNRDQRDNSYQVVDYVPTYNRLSPYLLLPLGDELHTQLVVSPTDSVQSSSSSSSPPLEEETETPVYCGDVAQLWREGQARGKAGTFDSCGALYRRQTDLGRRLFGDDDNGDNNHNWLAAQTMPEEFSTEIDLQQHQGAGGNSGPPSVASLLAAELHNAELAAQSLGQEEQKSSEFIKDANSFWHDDGDKRVKDLELEDAALNWQLNNLKSELAATRHLYSQRQRELYSLQKLPFLKT